MSKKSKRIYLIEGAYYRENSFLMAYTEEEVEWIRNGGEIPSTIRKAADEGYDIDIEWMEEIEDWPKHSQKSLHRIIGTTALSYLGDYKDNIDLSGYIWTEFTEVGLY